MTLTERRLRAIQVRIASDGRRVYLTAPEFWNSRSHGLLVAACVLPLVFWSRAMAAPLEAWADFLGACFAETEPKR